MTCAHSTEDSKFPLSGCLRHPSYDRVREYLPLPQGPAPLTEEFMRDIIREEHEDELE